MLRIKFFFLTICASAILTSCKSSTDSETMLPCNNIATTHNQPATTSNNTKNFSSIRISDNELRAIGYKIYLNECSGKIENLTYWNPKEPFPSMGIAHFVWYPINYNRPHGDSFSKMLLFYKQNGINLPDWIKKTNYKCPWTTRSAFYRNFNASQMKDLRNLLKNTIDLQTKFILERFQQKIDGIFQTPQTTPQMKQHVQYQFYRVAHSPMGLYALIDYVNFKGAGTTCSWGLLQVLEIMHGQGVGKHAIDEFARCAKTVLKKRVTQSKNKSIERNLNGWYKRVDTYRQITI